MNVHRCQAAGEISLALLYDDLSSSFSTTTARYCTPKMACTRWFCACDKHVRASRALANVIGAVVLVGKEEQEHPFFLPLASSNRSKKKKGGADSFVLPLRNLQSTTRDRW